MSLQANFRHLTSQSYSVQCFHLNFFTWDYLPINPWSSWSYPVSIHYMYDTLYLITPLHTTLPWYHHSSRTGSLLVKLIFYYRLHFPSQAAVLLLRNSILNFTVSGQLKVVYFRTSYQNIRGKLFNIFSFQFISILLCNSRN